MMLMPGISSSQIPAQVRLFLAVSMERWGLHKRIALAIVAEIQAVMAGRGGGYEAAAEDAQCRPAAGPSRWGT